MRGAVLVVLAVVGAVVVSANRANIRTITIEELLNAHPDLRATLSAKISDTKPSQPSLATQQPVIPKSQAPTAITTTTPAPQADSPTTPTAATTPTGRRVRGRKRGRPGARRRRPVGETSARFGQDNQEETPHRLRVVPQEPVQKNARSFPRGL